MASAETATGSSPRARRRSASAIATAVLPTPVGPKTAMTCTASQYRHCSMPVRIGTGLSTVLEPRIAAFEAASAAGAELGGRDCDLAVVFVSGGLLAVPEVVLEAIHDVLAPDGLIGCGAGGVIGHGREIETGSAGGGWGASPRGRPPAALPPPGEGPRGGGGAPRRGAHLGRA